MTSTKGGAENALVLGSILVVITTIINMLGVKLMARINNIGVTAELCGASILIILLLFHLHHPPSVIAHSYGYGAGHPWGYFGALLVGGLVSAYVMYGFDTAGTLAEETNDPRRHAPPAIIRAIAAAAIIGGLVILLGIMSNKNIANKNIGLLGLPYVIKQAFGNTTGNVFLADTALAIFVCCLAVQTATIRMLFSMARDNRLPFGSAVARVSGRRKVPVVPALVTGILTLVLMAINVGNQSAFYVLTSLAIIMFYLAYLGVTLPMLMRFALSHRPPTGFFRGLVVEHSGEHRGLLDLKHGGVIPIVDLARWAGIAAGVTSASTVERLRAAGEAGTLSSGDANTLEEAFDLVTGLRLAHQVQQLREGQEPDDYVDPARLSKLTRTHLREAFRAIASIQKRISAELGGAVS